MANLRAPDNAEIDFVDFENALFCVFILKKFPKNLIPPPLTFW